MADGVHQVRFAQTDASVEKERVIGGGGVLRNGESRRMREVIGTADDKGFKGVFRV
ncbi:hypothetical protein SDC9_96237 [bioreactor metagenome]|uniref:Uncharacterized protein n=1 Tax=bioreactor metagenome TaxID=1076179 RepID=A0A645A8X0_9ZZZZ